MISKEDLQFIKSHAPCYIYDKSVIRSHAEKLKDILPGYTVLASVKTNPFLPVLRTFNEQGIGADAASIGEVRAAAQAGMKPGDIYYSAAGKTNEELEEGLFSSVLTADSIGEIERISGIARKRGIHAEIGVRINPDFTLDSDKGVTGKFGVCEEELPALSKALDKLSNVTVKGIHVHIKSQQLDAERLGRSYEKIYEMAERIQKLAHFELEFVNFGGGVGIVYDESAEKPLDLQVLAQYAAAVAEKNTRSLHARLLVESGRFLSCESGTYYTDVIDIKNVRGKQYVIVRGGMNGFLRPVMTNVLNHLLPGVEFPPPEPLYTRSHSFEFDILNDETKYETYDICGCLCTAADVLLADAYMKKANIGDIISVSKAGSYAYALTPMLFSGHAAPGQYLKDGTTYIEK